MIEESIQLQEMIQFTKTAQLEATKLLALKTALEEIASTKATTKQIHTFSLIF
jgi:hypothetical protein